MSSRPSQGEYDRVGLRHPGDSSPESAEHSTHDIRTIRTVRSSMSIDSNSPLNPTLGQSTTYPPRHVQIAPDSGPPPGPSMPEPNVSGKMGHGSRNASWDLLAGFRDFEAGYGQYDSRNASEAYLAFAEGDIPQNKAGICLPPIVDLSSHTAYRSSQDSITIYSMHRLSLGGRCSSSLSSQFCGFRVYLVSRHFRMLLSGE
jgi:hypothetical protein